MAWERRGDLRPSAALMTSFAGMVLAVEGEIVIDDNGHLVRQVLML